MTEKIETKIDKSQYYENYGPVERIQFVVPTKDRPHIVGYTVSGKISRRDILNFSNQLAEIEEIARTEYAQRQGLLDYDENLLQNELKEYVKNNDAADKNDYISYKIDEFISDRRAIDKYYKEKEPIYTQYAQDLIAAKKEGKNLDEVKTPQQRQSLMQQVFSASLSDLGIKSTIEHLNDDELAVTSELFKDGFPTKETLEDAYQTYQNKAREIRRQFDSERRAKLFDTLMKQYGKRLLADYTAGQEYLQNGKLPIDGDKAKEEFSKMSLKEVTEKYGVEYMWSQRGIALIGEKIKQTKDNPKGLAETLIAARAIVQQRTKCFHVPLANRELLAELVEKEYKNLPKNPAYDKYSEVDKQFRNLFKAMLPLKGEDEYVARMEKAENASDFLKNRIKRYNTLTTRLQENLNQTVDISAAKKRLQQRLSDKENEKKGNGGMIAADKHAQAVQKIAENGILLKEGSSVDFDAYRQKADKELHEKSVNRLNAFNKKQAARKSGKESR